MPGIRGGGDAFAQEIRGAVLAGLELVSHHRHLGIEVRLGDEGVEHAVGFEIERPGEIGLARGEGLEIVGAVEGGGAVPACTAHLELVLDIAMPGCAFEQQVLEQVRSLEKEVAALKGKVASSQGDELMLQAIDIKGLNVLAARLEGADAKTLRETMDKLKDKLKTAVIVLAAADGDKVQIAAGVTADSIGKVKAGELVNFVAQQVGGKGGGKADMAMAGGTDAAKLPDALKSVLAWVTERV